MQEKTIIQARNEYENKSTTINTSMKPAEIIQRIKFLLEALETEGDITIYHKK